jgi:hypothetical protein
MPATGPGVLGTASDPLTQQEGAGGEGDLVQQQMLQKEGKEVAVEVAVKHLQANRTVRRGLEQGTKTTGEHTAPGPQSKSKCFVPTPLNMEQT